MDNTEISIVVESRLSGPASGHVSIIADPDNKIDFIIKEFCREKDVPYQSLYVLRTSGDTVLESDSTLAASNICDGDTLYLTTFSSGDEIFGFNNWCVMASISLLIGVVGLVAIFVIYSTTGTIPSDFGIIFDAGSTHTEMMVYKWDGEKINNTGKPLQVHQCTVKGAGIASYIGHLDDLEDALLDCSNEAKSVIPGGRVSKTLIYLGATGGMRLLSIKNASAVSDVMNAVDDALSKSGFQYQTGMASIISGTIEGADAWITSNYLTEALLVDSNNNFVGTLDLGGASTQFAIQASQQQSLSNETVDVTLYGSPYDIFTRSYLCFGSVQAWNRHFAELTVGWDLKSSIEDSCLPTGYSRTLSLKEIFYSPCSTMDSSLTPSPSSDLNVTFMGSSSFKNCSKHVRSLFNASSCTEYYKHDYCFQPQDLSSFQTPFLAISGFTDVVQFLNLSSTPTMEEFNDALINVCQNNWTTSAGVPTYSSSLRKIPSESFCFEGQYAYNMLTVGYNFNNSWNLLQFINTVNDTELGWTLGYMINVTNGIAAEVPSQPFQLSVFIFLIVLFIAFMVLAVTFAVHAWMRKHKSPTYQRLSQYGAI